MHSNIKEIIKRILEIIAEIESYEFYRNNLLYSSDVLFREYQEGRYTYKEYNLLLQSLLKGRSKKEWARYYDSYVYSLLKKIEPLLSQIIYTAYHDRSADELSVSKGISIFKAPVALEPSAASSKALVKVPEEKYEFVEVKRQSIVSKLRESMVPRQAEKQGEEAAGEPSAALSGARRKEEQKIIAASEKSRQAKPMLPGKKAAFLDALKSAVTHKKEEELKVALRPEEDRALKKLITHVDEINKEVPKFTVREPSSVLGIRLKLMLLNLHFIRRSISAKKIKVRETKEEKEEERAAGYYAKEEEIEEKIEERMPVPVLFKRPSSIREMLSSASERISDAYASLKRSFYVEKETGVPVKARPVKLPAAGAEGAAAAKGAAAGRPVLEKGKVAFSVFAPIKAWYRRREEEQKRFMSKETRVPHSMQVEVLRKKIVPVFEEEKIPATLLTEEVNKIKGIMEERKRFKIYQPSYFGSVANTLVKKFTFYLIDRFPGLFKSLYDSLRLANIKVLSNTYVNIMVLTVMLSFIASSVIFSIFFAIVSNPFFIILPKAMVMGLIISVVVFILFYMYPSIRASARERDINTNLPFAINHVAAVAGSGVPPTKMFKLLVESEEYGEIAVELGKVVEYVDLFGYDLLTAIRSVSLTAPSVALKEFLEGIVSTVESGSDIKDYLKEKSSEAMLSYELERQKYLETIATYSDVYTGILIAAPLFFIVALSLVSMLGGRIGGIDINIIIVLGAYVVIPVMNILFLLFIEVTQPEV